MKADDVAYYGFEKDMNMDEAVDCTSAEIEVGTHDHYIGAELQIPDKILIKRMARLRQIFRDSYGNPEGTGKYRAWVYDTDYEIGFFDVSTSKLTVNIVAENMLSQVN